MQAPTVSEIKRAFAGPFDAKRFGLTMLALEVHGHTDGQMYRLALAGDSELSRGEWESRVVRARAEFPFAAVKPGTILRIAKKRYEVQVVDHHAHIVDLKLVGGKSKALITLMPHGDKRGRFVLSTGRSSRVIEHFGIETHEVEVTEYTRDDGIVMFRRTEGWSLRCIKGPAWFWNFETNEWVIAHTIKPESEHRFTRDHDTAREALDVVVRCTWTV